MDDSIQEPGLDREPANPDTTVTGDAGCGCEDEDMTINASKVIEECLSEGNYVAKTTQGSDADHYQHSTLSGYLLNKIPDETSVEMQGPSTELLNKSESLQPHNDKTSTSCYNLTEIGNSTNKTLFEEGLPNKKLVVSDSLQPGLDKSSIASGNSKETSNSPALNCFDQSLSKLSIKPNNEDLLKQVLVKNMKVACKTTEPIPTLNKVEIFTRETGPKWRNVLNALVTPRLITKNLPEAFNSLPIAGRPTGQETVQDLQDRKLREFVGTDLNEEEFRRLSHYCSPESAKTDKELVMSTLVPTVLPEPCDIDTMEAYSDDHKDSKLYIVKKHKMREAMENESRNFVKRLKYRGIRLIPFMNSQEVQSNESMPAADQLEPGKDMLFHIRIYRPFCYNFTQRHNLIQQSPSRHSVFSRDALISSQTPLYALRENMICPNDVEARHDVANALDTCTAASTTARELFPSGFMFINNVFYVDDRPGCKDMSAVIREWAAKKDIGKFDMLPMTVKMQDVPVRLCHPEVYVHQGNCEHIFTISEVRLVNASDPLNVDHYPCYTSVSQKHSVYCTTCAEFCAKWIVVGSDRVPFDPAFFCDLCLKYYLYKDDKPVEKFKVFGYRSNETDILKMHV